MRKFIIVLPVLALFLFAGSQASAGMMNWDSDDSWGNSYNMMQYVGDRVAGSDAQEMKGLVSKMMGGTLTQDEANRLSDLSRQYPSSMSLMMDRYGGYSEHALAYNMMPWMSSWAGGFWMWAIGLSVLVWLLVGVLVLMWLWKQIVRKK